MTPTDTASWPMDRWTGLLILSVGYTRATSSSSRRMRYSDLYSLSYILALLGDDVPEKPLVGLGQGRAEVRARPPAEVLEPARVQPLARHPVRPRRVEHQPAAVPDHVGDEVGRLGDGQVRAAAEVDRLGPVVVVHDEHARV